MVGFTDVTARANLDALVTAYPYLALFSVIGTDAGTGFTESNFTGYARQNTIGLWAAASGSAPAIKQNSGTIQFPTSTSSNPNAVAIGLYSALTGGTLGFYNYIGSNLWQPATFSNASPSVITLPGHGFSNGDSVIMTTEIGSEGTIPSGFTTGIKTVGGVTTDTFNVGVNASNTGGLMVKKIIPQVIITNMIIVFAANQLTLSLA